MIRITVRISQDTKIWLKDIESTSRTQSAICNEAIILYYRIYLYIKPIIIRYRDTDYSCFITPVIDNHIYDYLLTLNPRRTNRGHGSVGGHVRNALSIYRRTFDVIGIYNLYEINLTDDDGVLDLVKQLGIISPTGAVNI